MGQVAETQEKFATLECNDCFGEPFVVAIDTRTPSLRHVFGEIRVDLVGSLGESDVDDVGVAGDLQPRIGKNLVGSVLKTTAWEPQSRKRQNLGPRIFGSCSAASTRSRSGCQVECRKIVPAIRLDVLAARSTVGSMTREGSNGSLAAAWGGDLFCSGVRWKP